MVLVTGNRGVLSHSSQFIKLMYLKHSLDIESRIAFSAIKSSLFACLSHHLMMIDKYGDMRKRKKFSEMAGVLD